MTTITSTEKIKNSILAANPSADSTILQEFCFLVDKHNLKWVPSKEGVGAYFVMSQVSLAKGLKSTDYANYWSPDAKSTTLVKQEPSESLAGKAFKTEGERLSRVKKVWLETWGENLGRVNSLWLGDWAHCYAYLTQGKSTAAKDFQALGAKTIEKVVLRDIKKIQIDENTLQRQIIELASYSNINFKFEVGVKNTFLTPDEASHRRWDWVERLPKVVKVYELKSHTLSEQDINTTLFDKHYLELAAEKFPNKPIELIFTSPKGISWEAKTLIKELMDDQSGYTTIQGVRAKISFIDLQEVAQRLVTNIIDNSPIESWFWLLNKLRTEDLQYVVSPHTVAKLNGQVAEGYQSGKLIKKSNVVYLPSANQIAA